MIHCLNDFYEFQKYSNRRNNNLWRDYINHYNYSSTNLTTNRLYRLVSKKPPRGEYCIFDAIPAVWPICFASKFSQVPSGVIFGFIRVLSLGLAQC